jgi:hypothetical protein
MRKIRTGVQSAGAFTPGMRYSGISSISIYKFKIKQIHSYLIGN